MINFRRITLFSLVVVASVGFVSVQPQAVNPSQPESNQSLYGLPSSRPQGEKPGSPPSPLPPASQRVKYSAKPGDVVVHFDRDHEIQRLQYVLQNGQLATLYQNHQTNGRVPSQVQPPPADLHRHEEVVLSSTNAASSHPPSDPRPGQGQQVRQHPLPPPALQQFPGSLILDHSIDPDQTIEILNSKLNKVSHIVGNHKTIPISGNNDDSRLAILATVAGDAIHNGAQVGGTKLHHAGILLNKLKTKVGHKLRELPNIVDSKLRTKSSPGRVFVDQPNNKFVVLDDDDEKSSSSSISSSDGVKMHQLPPNVQSILEEVSRQQANMQS